MPYVSIEMFLYSLKYLEVETKTVNNTQKISLVSVQTAAQIFTRCVLLYMYTYRGSRRM